MRYLFIILTSFFVQSQTEVSGIIDEETNWTVSGSPYTIIENTTFNSDLTIEAGVTVNLSGGYLRVKGKLIANGTESAIIKFTGQHGVWLDNTDTTFNQNKEYVDGNSFEYCQFDIAANGQALDIGEFAVFLDHSSALIKNSEFNGEVGVVFDHIRNNSDRNTGSVISNSQFKLNGRYAISIAGFSCGSSRDISNNLIEKNTFDNSPVRLAGHCVNSFNNVFKQNSFKNCNSTALYLGWGNVVPGVLGADIYNNIFIDNVTAVVIGSRPGNSLNESDDYGPSRIRYNVFLNNSSNAIKADGTYHNDSLEINNNIIVNSGSDDIYLDDEAGCKINNNLIYNVSASSGNLLSFIDSYQDSDSKNNYIKNNTFYSLSRDIITSFYGGNTIENNNIFGSSFSYLIKATGDGANTIFTNNTVSSIVLDVIEDKILDRSDDVDLYDVVASGTTIQPRTDTPILPPQKTVKVISGNNLELSWEANPESDIAGYKLYYGNPTGYSYDNVIDLGNVTSYLFEGGAQYDNVALTAYDSGSGDGSHDSGSGDGSHDSGSGDGSHDSGSGDGSHDSGSGDGSHDSGSGDGSHDSGSGDGSHDSGSGDGSSENLFFNEKQVLGEESWFSIFQTNPTITVSTTKTNVAEGSITKIKFDLDQPASEKLSLSVNSSGDASFGTDYSFNYNFFYQDFEDFAVSSSESSEPENINYYSNFTGGTPSRTINYNSKVISDSNNTFLKIKLHNQSEWQATNSFIYLENVELPIIEPEIGNKYKIKLKFYCSSKLQRLYFSSPINKDLPISFDDLSQTDWNDLELEFTSLSTNFRPSINITYSNDNSDTFFYIDDYSIECISCKESPNPFKVDIINNKTNLISILAFDDFEDEQTETINVDFTLSGSGELSAESLSFNLLNSKTTITKTENPFPGLSQGDVSWGDFDNDGDKDVALMGVSNVSGAVTAIYENKGSEGFVNTNQNFERVIDGTLEWADLNKDGFIDLIVSGYNVNEPSTKVYLNRDASYFELDDTYNIPDLYATKLAFGDLDNDGDIDYLIVGYDSSDQVKRYYGFKRNSGDGYDLVTPNISPNIGDHFLIFDKDSDGDNDVVSSNTSVTNTLYSGSQGDGIDYYSLQNGGNIIAFKGSSPGAGPEQLTTNGYIAVGDLDNNGYNDFILTGEDSNGSGLTKLYLGSSNGVIETSDYELEGLRDSTAEFIDYDKDGDLDIFLTGVSDSGGNQTILYEVDVTNKSNQAPPKITSTSYENLGGGNVKLSWDAPEDDFSSELGYNVRIGTTPGGSELSNTESNLETGDRLINKAPPTFNNFYIRQLDPGTYYWAVQAIDGGYKGGEFTEEKSFTLTYDWKILNQGGIIDNSISGKTNPVLKFVDIDNDNDLDILYGGENSSTSILRNDDIKFTSIGNTLNNNLKYISVGDINNDLSTDIFGSSNNSYYFSDGSNVTYFNDVLYDAIGRIIDTNNDGKKELVVLGKSSQTSSAKLKLYVYDYNGGFSSNSNNNRKDYSSQITSLLNSSYDLGDFDNDQDVDLILSGFSAFDGIKTILYENVTEPGGELTLVATDNNLASVRDGSNDFIDFDSDGDLDVVMSGTSFSSDIFEVYLNNGSTTWPRVDVNLGGIRNTKVDLGDFNGDGYSDLLYTGTQTGSGKITKLSEFDPNNLTYIDSDFDVSDIKDAAVEFGDLDGDGDLDFVIAGTSESTSQNIFRTYINFRNDSYDVLNPPSDRKYDVLVKHDGLDTTMKNTSSVEVTAIQLEYENDADINFAESISSLSNLNNGDQLTIVQNNNQVLVYGDVTKRFSSSSSYEPILVHNSADNTLKEILSVTAYVGGRLKSITSKSKIYKEGLTTNSLPKRKLKAMSITSTDTQSEEIILNQRPDMPFILSEEVVNQSNNQGKTEVLLSWNQAFDDNTPFEGLTYSIKVGTSPGAEDVVSSNANTNGLLKSSQKGNAEHNTSWKLALQPGEYYWSVQSIDNSFNGSLFSTERNFEIINDGTLSKPDTIEDINTTIYPNPVKRDFTISSTEFPIENVSIYNVRGQLVGYKLTSRSKYKVTINVGELTKGVYVIVIESGDTKIAQKLIKE